MVAVAASVPAKAVEAVVVVEVVSAVVAVVAASEEAEALAVAEASAEEDRHWTKIGDLSPVLSRKWLFVHTTFEEKHRKKHQLVEIVLTLPSINNILIDTAMTKNRNFAMLMLMSVAAAVTMTFTVE